VGNAALWTTLECLHQAYVVDSRVFVWFMSKDLKAVDYIMVAVWMISVSRHCGVMIWRGPVRLRRLIPNRLIRQPCADSKCRITFGDHAPPTPPPPPPLSLP
jgi:hypothetical protein